MSSHLCKRYTQVSGEVLQYQSQSVCVFAQGLTNEQELIDRLVGPVHDGQLISL